MKDRVKIGVIGLGGRGYNMMKWVFMPMKDEGVDIVAVCDVISARAEKAADAVSESGAKKPFVTTDYNELLSLEGLDAVYIAVSWEAHVEIAVAAMKAGVYVGLEAGGAYSLDDCYKLVHTYEETGTELMFMENCCYGKRELMALNMARQGVFGEIMHCNGAYCHDLRKEVTEGLENGHYRLRNYIYRNCENYPTHEIGPIAKLLNINNGNRFLTLSSFSSRAKGMHEYTVKTKGEDHPLAKVDFSQGDVVTTVITCAGGQTVCITLETCLPRGYSRRFEVHGTRGMYMEDNDSIFIDGNEEHQKNEFNWKPMWGNAEKFEEEYLHPLWKSGKIENDAHGGIDHLTVYAFINAVKTGAHAPIDVYDAATYMSISVLSEDSIALGGAPVAIPDFTAGRWTERVDIADNEYTLDNLDIGKDLYHIDKK
ncbi:MAG: Gfo/Idh/MocA family oxidoreductase [Acutalibacteraceae bacterium]|nr:Gfo/Idh/MocA family oxidoreductase [Acutalibacteraceae bacterium]